MHQDFLTSIFFPSGVGDFTVSDVSFLPDPCALPEQQKKRSLNEKEKLIYAPLSGVGGLVYDKDAVYIDLGGSHANRGAEVRIKTLGIILGNVEQSCSVEVLVQYSIEEINSVLVKLFSLYPKLLLLHRCQCR